MKFALNQKELKFLTENYPEFLEKEYKNDFITLSVSESCGLVSMLVKDHGVLNPVVNSLIFKNDVRVKPTMYSINA
jgi:hypothetical protein